MLGRLLNTAASTLNPASYSAKPGHHLESVTEEEHTSGLLFPDASLLRRSNTHAYPLHSTFNSPNASTAGAYDDRGGVDLDYMRDFRVIIAQNALGDRDACVLLDTQAPHASEVAPQGLGLEPQLFEGAGPRHARTVSTLSARAPRRGLLSQSTTADPSPLSVAAETRRSPPIMSGAFMRARRRSSTLAAAGGHHDTGHPRLAADSTDSGLLNCIFGSSAFSYRGSSTKMHIISADGEPTRAPGSPAAWTAPGGEGPKPPAKVTVLLTRMFSVNLPEARDPTASPDRHPHDGGAHSFYPDSLPEAGFPFPDVAKRKKIKEKKTPMYAVAITVQIPLLSVRGGGARPTSRVSGLGPDASPRPGGAGSLDSEDRGRGGFLLDDSLSGATPPASLDERIDLLVDHWDVINRTLSHLERLARAEIRVVLQQADAAATLHPKPAKAPNMQRTNQTVVHLPVNSLAVNARLRDEAVRSMRRIASSLQTPPVVTGQSRWGVWREEGRSIARTLGDKEHSFFFMVLVTAFLGNHTEWLNSLGPEWYRRRHYLQQRAQPPEADPPLAHRTVIVSGDKMTARRLIFLLAAFLPQKQRFESFLPSPLRPGTAASARAPSQSPPHVPLLRQESLRRAIERRSRAQRLTQEPPRRRSASASSGETDAAPAELDDRPRRASDARSMRTRGVAVPARDGRRTNAGPATTSTATPASTVPVPHFASQGRGERGGTDPAVMAEEEEDAAAGHDSLASENLLKTLQRSDSSVLGTNSSVPSAAGRWGTLFAGLWGPRPASSTDRRDEDPAAIPPRRRAVSVQVGSAGPKRGPPPTLRQMVRETQVAGPPAPGPAPALAPAPSGHISIPHAHAPHPRADDGELPPELLSTTEPKASSLKMSVHGSDGVVDVDLPLPGFVSLSSSGESTTASPQKPRTSVTSVDAGASTHSSVSGFQCPGREPDGLNINVAGWLRRFHEDFLLQAVRPYPGLDADIRRAMQAEPTPNPVPADAEGPDRWVDVATTLVADVRQSTVKRLRLRRRGPGISGASAPGTPRHVGSGSGLATPFASLFGAPTTTTTTTTTTTITPAPGPILADPGAIEEQFVEEPVMDLDGTLVDALERVLAQSVPPSMAPTRAPSPSRARRGGADDKPEMLGRDELPSLEVPRTECRRLVLGALEEVVRSVTAEHCREDVEGELGVGDRERRRSMAGVDNTLREGIRRWLLDVEEAW
ncbi:uncharacterized protein BDW47DRAFT_124371 [Aspergillus candidus]|uniref:Folliculin-interacting protein N-terminus-domain-containing protein n=1 Tax=Aspergillus candidus TaxID=41067 RepID=A0A2I2FGE1_ASPCN|nr:folliculin-interacting protein N-terminus-domain-containing protein [Aspergillus candidus]PLB39693.1 folliculin-interacting protein N-terminus-domain-containing protein [Aspergillus candidus]